MKTATLYNKKGEQLDTVTRESINAALAALRIRWQLKGTRLKIFKHIGGNDVIVLDNRE